jgi:hypothetical protein
MARMTLAEQEGVSLNQFLVFLLSQASAVDSVRRQRDRFEAMRSRVPKEEAEEALAQLLAARR